MGDNWIEDQRKQLQEQYSKCKAAKKSVLEAFSVYLLRILNGLSQMESSKLYGYETQILEEAMKLFCMHYITQVDAALNPNICTDDKKMIIEDVEDAISKISNVYKNVIDSTANSDRQMFTSQAVETSIYDISPKLFATYSVILETLVTLFNKKGVYAFLLHPSLKSNIETVSLFDMREQEGKVVLIYVPENEIEKISQIPIYLLHEVFHVLTKEERNRQDRACRMEIHVCNAILQRIFKNVCFDFVDGEGADRKIKDELVKRWFKIDERIEELKEIKADERYFYSKNVLSQIRKNWRKSLGEIYVRLGDDLRQVLNNKKYKQGENPYQRIVQIEWEIQRNLVEILARSLVERYAYMYMTIYRETYADIACVLTTGISPEKYEQAFKDSEIISDELDQDIIRNLRIGIVAKAIAVCGDVDHAEEWKKYSEIHDFRKQDKRGDQIVQESGKTDCDDKIQIMDEDLISFEEILINCSKKLWKILGEKNSKFAEFRKIIRDMNLIEILNGSVNEKLRKL